jgi:class 3 adenylate cyclase/tetratricopeptide (TPR) repeat protein
MAMVLPEKSSAPASETVQQPPANLVESRNRTIEELLRERIRLDELLQQAFRRDATLLFTDIQDSTAYFEQRGDLSGRQMVQRHNDLLFPIVSQYQGTILKTIGDAIMASFTEPAAAVRSAIAMQRALRDYNAGQRVADQIHIRIGINSGLSFVESQDAFGDVVNVAARVESCALPDQILITSATYERLPDSIPCRFLGTTQVKGKSAPIELYEVHWDERKTLQETVLLRGPGVIKPLEKIFMLEVSREDERLKLSAHEYWPGEQRPVRHYEYKQVSLETVEQDVQTMMSLLNRATNRRGILEAAIWQEIKAKGEALYDQLLTSEIREQLRLSSATNLVLSIDDTLVQIPWELLFDGHAFLCRRFNMGRLVHTRQTLVEGRRRKRQQALTMLIVADPQGDLEAAAREGSTIQEELGSQAERLHVDLLRTGVSTPDLRIRLSEYDVLHYAGHADYDLQAPVHSGWRLADGKFTARDILQIGETTPVPALVFCNACGSGQPEAWEISQEAERGIYGLANAFLLAGAQHYIGTFWGVPDEPSAALAIAFYRALAQGRGVGEALRHARQALAERYGETSVVWASYVLYGDPTYCYLASMQAAPSVGEEAAAPPVSRQEGKPTRHRKWSLLLGAGALVILGLLFAALVTGRLWRNSSPDASSLTAAYQALDQKDWQRAEALFLHLGESQEAQVKSQAYAGLAALALARGDYQQALDLAAQAEALDSEIAYSHVVRGNILFNQGKVAEATSEYHIATQKSHGTPWQQAIAYNRLGRIHAAQGQVDKALEQYDRALQQNRDMAVVYTNKGYLLEQQGKHQEALGLYRRALQINPDDPLTVSLLREAERREQLARDTERRQRIDQLVAELVRAHRQGQRQPPPRDGWTSMPLTLAFLSLQHQGAPSPRAGEEEFLRLSMVQALRTSGRIIPVEREILDKLLTELKLSTTELVDPQVALRVGNILAARLIAVGSFTRFGGAGQLTVRLIETETTRIRASASVIVERPDDIARAVQRVSKALLHALRQAYPLRGRIARVTPQGVILNLGTEQGVTPGLVMQVFGPAEPLEISGEVIGYRPTPVGRIQVTEVEAQFAQARVLEQTEALQQGWKVQELREK